MTTTIFFDMDGTIADLYGVENWLDYLIASDALPYEIAKPLIRLNALARILNRLQKQGYKVGVISWLAKNSNTDYDEKVTKAKKEWLIENFNADCTEMEGAAIAQTAYLNHIPFLIIRAISDKADDSAHMDYPEFESMAIKNSVLILKSIIEKI